jgi:hypothetical protein
MEEEGIDMNRKLKYSLIIIIWYWLAIGLCSLIYQYNQAKAVVHLIEITVEYFIMLEAIDYLIP